MQVGPQPDEGQKQEWTEAPLPVETEPDHQYAHHQEVEQLGTGSPGCRTRKRPDQGQHRGQRRMQVRPPQNDVEADGAGRHHAGEDGNQERQAAKLVEQVHGEIGQPLVHHPGVAGGAEGVEIDVGNGAGRDHEAPVGQVPP